MGLTSILKKSKRCNILCVMSVDPLKSQMNARKSQQLFLNELSVKDFIYTFALFMSQISDKSVRNCKNHLIEYTHIYKCPKDRFKVLNVFIT